MPGEFEKRIQNQIKKFHLSPSTHVWEDIAIVLSKTKKTNRLKHVIPVAVLLLMIGVAIFIITKDLKKQPAIKQQQRSIVKTETHTGSNKNAAEIKQSNQSLQPAKNSITPTYIAAGNYTDLEPIENTLDYNSSFRNEHPQLTAMDKNYFNSSINEQRNYYSASANEKISGVIKAEAAKPFSNLLLTNLAKQQQQPAIALSTNGFVRNKPASKDAWSVMIASGTTNTIPKNLFYNKRTDLIYHPEPSASNPNPTPDTLKYLRKSYYGYHFTAGIQYERKLSNHWNFYTGLQYSYLTNKQKIGNKYNGIFNISQTIDTNNAPGKSFIKVPFHYADGLSGTLTNSANWLEIPISAGYTFNPSSKVKVQLRSGFTVAYMFNYLWLIADGRYSKFYYSPDLTNSWIVNWHGDAAVQFKNKMVTGLRLKRSLSPVANSTVQPSLYWNNFSVYTTIPLH